MKRGNGISTKLFFVILFWSAVFNSLNAQWSTDPLVNNAISTFNFYDKFVPVVVSDGSGGAIIAWEDSRDDGSFFDIYAQRINASGVILWTANGVAISTGPEDKRAPAIISDGSGGAIITWRDSRTGYALNDIYAQRINASGAVQWTADGIAICTVAGDQSSQTIASDGSGGAIITWVDQRSGSGTGYKIYAQRIDANGSIHSGWTTDGNAICSNLSGTRNVPTIVGDGSGGAIITWSDYRNLSNYDIYAQRINGSGDTVWTTNGVAICTFAGNETRPKIVNDGSTGAIIMWGEDRGMYAQRIDASGVVQWAVNGVAIGPLTGDGFSALSDGSGGVIISFKDNRSFFSFDIYAQKVNASGVVQWITDGVPICTSAENQQNETIVSDGVGGAIVTWHDQRNASYDIYAQRINAVGDTLWDADGTEIATHSGAKLFPTICSDGASGAIVTWYDYRSGFNSDIYAAQINANGSLGAGLLPVELVSLTASTKNNSVQLKWTTATEINNYGFEVERLAFNNSGWTKIVFIPGNGNSNSIKMYSFIDSDIQSGKYAYRLKQIDNDGAYEYSNEIEVNLGFPAAFSLSQNYPNPFNPSTSIKYQVSSIAQVTLKLYDVLGNEVATLVNEEKPAGSYEVEFNASQLSSGIYFYKLQVDGFISTKKMTLIK